MQKVVTRFPPSPTGKLHIGNARTALFNYLFAKHHGGTMYFRFEDTDKERSKKEYEEEILKSLDWLGLEYTWPNMHRQSERADVYKKYFHTLIDADVAYEAEVSEADPTKKVVRFRNPNKTITFTDLIRGEVTVNTTDLGDFIIARNIDDPLYHLAVVIDDHEMGVTHVIRGEDHISNTPRQILVLEALGFERPIYAHLPLILAKDRSKFSKRHGSATVADYIDAGYLPDAVFNYLALLGWHPSDDQEIFSRAELIERFTFDQVSKSGAIFDEEKFKWFNREHIRRLSDAAFAHKVREFIPGDYGKPEVFKRLLPSLRERLETFGDLGGMIASGDLAYYFEKPSYTAQELLGKDASKEEAKEHLTHALSTLESMSDRAFTAVSIKERLWDYATEKGRGAVLWPMRYALSGKKQSPDPFTLAEILGKEETLVRLKEAISLLAV